MFGRPYYIAYTVLLTFCFVLLTMLYCLQSSISVVYKGEKIGEQILINLMEHVNAFIINVLTETFVNYLSYLLIPTDRNIFLIKASHAPITICCLKAHFSGTLF